MTSNADCGVEMRMAEVNSAPTMLSAARPPINRPYCNQLRPVADQYREYPGHSATVFVTFAVFDG